MSDEWRAAMLRSRSLKSGPKLTLVVLLDHLADDGTIRVHQHVVGHELGIARQRVCEHLGAAKAAGWLVEVQEGSYGRPAVLRLGGGWLPEDASTARNPGQLEPVTARKTGQLGGNGTEERAVVQPQQHGKPDTPVVTSKRDHGVGAPSSATAALGLDESPSSNPRPMPTATEPGKAPRTNPINRTTDTQHDEQQRQLRALEQLIQEQAS